MVTKLKLHGVYGHHANVYNDGTYLTRPKWNLGKSSDRKITIKNDVVTLEDGAQFDAAFFFEVNDIVSS